ncbi:contact-dependent growth inhibition system immunity protein [Variovorax sp. PBL-H6]|uniref:contact-dependent growth inhibition system immunity protein n=1 Tax=Variovorax sp. PBL-H6 TaxID=434009 RepID=UPI0013A530FB|nr:contact-dependent growth inhibition system immunity protein [Variovorax sp. PBL-H6]
MTEPARKKWASAYFNGDYYFIVTNSGYRGCARDPNGYEAHLAGSATDEEVGKALLQALSSSRFLKVEEIDEFFSLNRIMSSYESWVASLLDRYKYKTRRALFKNMMLCNITVTDEAMEIGPTQHERLEAWGRERGDGIQEVLLSIHSPAAEIGKALQEAFTLCE